MALLRPALVRKLIEFKADPQSDYSMEAGRCRVLWRGPAVCATVAKGNLAMMRPSEGKRMVFKAIQTAYVSYNSTVSPYII